MVVFGDFNERLSKALEAAIHKGRRYRRRGVAMLVYFSCEIGFQPGRKEAIVGLSCQDGKF